mmetsp:Transcript_3920/g.9684  ORF Transcript_3920/g.9684 Transcript_3920/m.9684 type:complete len:127 (+) Transcript_3920:10-390(+)
MGHFTKTGSCALCCFTVGLVLITVCIAVPNWFFLYYKEMGITKTTISWSVNGMRVLVKEAGSYKETVTYKVWEEKVDCSGDCFQPAALSCSSMKEAADAVSGFSADMVCVWGALNSKPCRPSGIIG